MLRQKSVGKKRPVLGRTIRTPGRVRVVRCVHLVDANLGIEVRREARSPSIQHEGLGDAGADTTRGGLYGPPKKRRPRGHRGRRGGEARLKRQRLRAFRSRRRGILFVPEGGVSRDGRESSRRTGLLRRGAVSRRGRGRGESANAAAPEPRVFFAQAPPENATVPIVGTTILFPRVEINCVTCRRSHVIPARSETVRASRFGNFGDAVLCRSILVQWREDPPRIKLTLPDGTYRVDLTTGGLVSDERVIERSGRGQRRGR